MKKICLICSFVFAFIVFCGVSVSAKTSSSELFEVSVGDGKLPIYYTLVENQIVVDSNNNEVGNLEGGVISLSDGSTYVISGENIIDESNNEVGTISGSVITINNGSVYNLLGKEIKERMQFNVYIKGLGDENKSYKWEHKFCYKFIGSDEICEVDITGDGDSNTKILSNGEYSYYFYDGHMPYYSEALEFEYITFKNKFVCLDCENNNEYNLNDIIFNSDDINYKYNYDISVEHVENEGRKYVYAYSSSNKVYVKAVFSNNSGSNYIFGNSPTYKLINEVCVDDNCVSEEIDKVYSSSDSNNENPFSITPYLGNLNFYYGGSNLMWVNNEISYEKAKYKTTLVCLTNCDSRRVENSVVLHEESYYFDYTKPSIDEKNTSIDSYDEIEYIKNSETKITFADDQSGLDEKRMKYYMIRPYSSSCSFGSTQEYSFINGESFSLGEGFNGGYCMYYVVYDKNGNYYTSDYYIYYFDNKGPVMTFNNSYNENKYYNYVSVNPSFSDSYSGFKEAYYLWSKDIINSDDYLVIKNNGNLYNDNISSSELDKDGSYYLYFVAYDNLNNHSFYDLGLFNIDTEGLKTNDVIVDTYDFNENYSNIGSIKISVDEMLDNEEFKCGFFLETSILLSELTTSCYNKQVVYLPTGLEGEYYFFVNVHDRANNYSLLRVIDKLKIDTKGPDISYDLLYDDNGYHIVNEVTLNISDLSGVNSSSLKYDWFLTSKMNVLSSDLNNSFVSGVGFGYPRGYYGEYKLYVSATDNLGNEVFKEIDRIFKIDTDVIRISLIGEDNVTILKGEKYEDLGAKAYKGDVLTGGRISEVNVQGEVNTNKAGTYYIVYSSGEGDLLVSVTRKVVVKNDFNYIVISGVLFAIGLGCISLRLFVRKRN